MTARLIDLTPDRIERASADGVLVGQLYCKCVVAHMVELLERGLATAALEAGKRGLRSMGQR